MSTPMVSAADSATRLEFRLNAEDWEGLYDQLEVWRADLGDGGPYHEITAESFLPAYVPADADGALLYPGPLVNLVGTTLDLLVGERVLQISFTGTDPFTYSSAASVIVAQSYGLLLAKVLAPGVLRLETVQAGAVALLQVMGGDAAPLLGLSYETPTNTGNGRDPRIPLIAGKTRYVFVDPRGNTAFLYKIRFRDSHQEIVSPFSAPFSSESSTNLDPSALVRGFLKLADYQGRPLRYAEVLINNTFQGMASGDFTVMGTSESKTTDENGYVEFFLVRGAEVSVAVAGTALVRTIIVPTDPEVESFNLFDPTNALPDVFTVKVPDIAFGARRSL